MVIVVQIALAVVLLVVVKQGLQTWAIADEAELKEQPTLPSSRGRTCKPDCPACQAEAHVSSVPPVRPAPRHKQKAGRPRSVNTDWHFCPQPGCSHYGWVGLGNIVSNGHPNGGRWRQLKCTVCGKHFSESTGTIFYRSPLAPDLLCQIITALAEGLNLQASARVFGVDPNTVKACLARAAEHMEAVSHYLIHDLHLTQVQVDELWSLVQEGDQPRARSGRRHACDWVWTAVDPFSKLWLATVVGDRSLAMAQLLIHAVVIVLAPGVVPLFLSDQLAHYATALLTHFGQWVTVERRSKYGPAPKPRWVPLPELYYAQVVKRRVGSRVVEVTQRVVFGTTEAVSSLLSAAGHTINTAFIERLNLTVRMHLPSLGRKVLSFAKTPEGLLQQLKLGRAYYNFCLPHLSLRLPWPEPIPTKGNGSPKLWQPRTPAMAAGLTDHVWSMREVLLFRVPPWRQEVNS
jgi:transposase-like protein/IS1 family transposase